MEIKTRYFCCGEIASTFPRTQWPILGESRACYKFCCFFFLNPYSSGQINSSIDFHFSAAVEFSGKTAIVFNYLLLTSRALTLNYIKNSL